MRSFFKKSFDTFLIFGFAVFILLDSFLIPHAYTSVSAEAASTQSSSSDTSGTASVSSSSSASSTEATVTDTSYQDDNVSITITTDRYEDTTIYVADVQISSIDYLKTALASGTYGRNITATTSSIADSVNAILAINGDYYGARNSGYVMRNGTLYRTTSSGSDQIDLAINADGSFSFYNEGTTDASSITNALQIFSFGPSLIENGTITVDENSEVGKAMASKPRTAICEIEPLHYLFVVADGRTTESQGLSLYQMAQYLSTLGVTNAYNLDGGGSSTMVFMGNVINKPTTSGNSIKERAVRDIIYIGESL